MNEDELKINMTGHPKLMGQTSGENEINKLRDRMECLESVVQKLAREIIKPPVQSFPEGPRDEVVGSSEKYSILVTEIERLNKLLGDKNEHFRRRCYRRRRNAPD